MAKKVRKPPAAGNLPPTGKRMLAKVYESAREKDDKQTSARKAWCAVGRQYYKKGERWLKRKEPLPKDKYPPGCAKATPADIERLEQYKAKKKKNANSRKAKKKATSSSTKKGSQQSRASRSSTPTLEGRKLKRNPLPKTELEHAADLGNVLEVRTSKNRLEFNERTKPKMFSNVKGNMLFWLHGGKPPRRVKPNPDGPATELYKRWTGNKRNPKSAGELDIPDRLFDSAENLGKAKYLAYRSDKFSRRGNPSDYEHPFSTGVQLFKMGGKKPPWLFALRGGGLKVTKRGIIG